MKKNWKVIGEIVVYILIVIIILGVAKIYPEFLSASKGMQFSKYDIYRSIMYLGIMIIGVLMEYKRIIKGFNSGFKVNIFRLIISLSLVFILFMPYELGMRITGFGTKFYILQYGIFRSVIAMIAGILLVRSITKEY